MPSLARGTRQPVVLAYLTAGLAFAGHLALGANGTNLALLFSAAWLLLLALTLATQSWARSALETLRLLPAAIPFAALMTVSALSLTPWEPGGVNPVWGWAPGASPAVSVVPYATLVEMLKLLALAAAFLMGALLGRNDDGLKATVWALLLVGSAYAAWALIDHAVNPTTLFGAPRHFTADRLSASFGSANTAATLFGSLALLALADLVRSHDRVRPHGPFHPSHLERLASGLVRPLLALSTATACLLLTQSRLGVGIAIGLALALLGALAMTRSRRTRILAPALGAGGIAVGLACAVLAQSLGPLEQRMGLLKAETLERAQVFAAHWGAFLTAPWSGYGLGSFARINALVMNSANAAALAPIGAAHNVYIQWLEEGGLLGAGWMFATVAVAGFQLASNIVRRRRPRALLLAIAAVLLLFLIHGAADYALQVPSMALFLSLLLGLGAAPTPDIGPWQGVERPAPAARAP
jgi:O-antigen ligase